MHSDYTYALDFYREDGTAIGQAAVEPDWTPALEWVHFEGIREGRLPAVMAASIASEVYRIDPVWHPTAGQPHVSSFQITLSANGSGAWSRRIPTTYLRGVAQQASVALTEKGLLQSGEIFRYLVSACAVTSAAHAPQPAATDFCVEEVVQPLPLTPASLETFLIGAVPAGSEHVAGDFPVFVPQAVLDEMTELARQAGDVETGGVLVGLLHRDAGIPEIFVEVTAQIAAPHTEAAATKLTFTADTWAAVRAALALRKRGELMVGWWHFHPDFCRLQNCPEEKRLRCTVSSAFFSAEDVALHTALFARGYNTALLISDSAAGGLTASAFGWRQGMVTTRGFYTLAPDLEDRSDASRSGP
jgi:proteasome lid subunit RPN8/RPN11